MAPTNYAPNGVQDNANIVFDSSQKWLIGQLATGRFILVKDNQTPSPVEALSGDATTGMLTALDLATNTSFRLPVYTTTTLPPATTNGRLIYTSDDGNVRVANGASWIILSAGAGAGVTASGALGTNQVIIGGGAAVVQALGTLGTTTTVLHGNAAGAPTFGAVNVGTDVTGTLGAANGGLGVASPTAHGILVGEGASAVTPLTLTNGQVLIGSTGNDPVAATLSAGAGVTITNGAGTITIASGGGALDKVTTNASFSNSLAENTLYTFSVPGGTLGTNNKLRLTVFFQLRGTDSVNAATTTFRFKYGGTTLHTIAHGNGDGSTVGTGSGAGTLLYDLMADGATNAQLGGYTAPGLVFKCTTSGRVMVPTAFPTTSLLGTAAVDSTSNQSLVLTAQMDTADPAVSVTLLAATLEKLS